MNRKFLALCSLCLCVSVARTWTQSSGAPSIDDILNLKRVGTPAISPDGRQVAYTIRETNWDENAYETEIWIGDTATGRSRQLTNARKSSLQPAWSPDGASLAFVSDRDGKRQIYRIAVAGGEAERLTNSEDGVTNFAWSPSGGQIAYTMIDPISEAMKDREKRWGDLRLEDLDQRYTHLHVLDLATRATRALTSGPLVVGAFNWSPDGTFIAFDHRTTSDAGDGGSADISIVNVATGERQVAVGQEGPDTNPVWSPDGQRLAFVSAMAKPFYFYQNNVIATVQPGVTGVPAVTSLTDAFDENPSLIAWTRAGIAFSAAQRTWSYLFTLDPATRVIARHAVRDQWIGSGFSLTRDGTRVAFISSGPSEFADVHVAPVATMVPVKVSDTAAQIASWPKHAREIVRWKSQDGATIEGVLHKPADFQAGRRYPLLVVIHGGPTGISRPVPYSNNAGYYPLDAFLARGALVLEPNYRGSAGYGEAFRSLNVRNLGIGDAWDVLSRRRRARGPGPGRRHPRGQHGLEPGRLHLGVPRDEALGSLPGPVGGRGHLGLDDLLRQHRHPPVHAAVP